MGENGPPYQHMPSDVAADEVDPSPADVPPGSDADAEADDGEWGEGWVPV